MYLVVDTSTKFAGVALTHKKRLYRAICWHSQQNHTVELAPAIADLLRTTGISPSELYGLGIALGPGGFSALRTGMSVVKGLAFALSIPVVGVSTLEAEAYPYLSTSNRVCALIPIGRDRIAWATYEVSQGKHHPIGNEHQGVVAELVGSVTKRTLFCGESAPDSTHNIKEVLGRTAIVATNYSPVIRLGGLAALAEERLEQGESHPLVDLLPNYLREPNITPPKPIRHVQRGSVARDHTGTRK